MAKLQDPEILEEDGEHSEGEESTVSKASLRKRARQAKPDGEGQAKSRKVGEGEGMVRPKIAKTRRTFAELAKAGARASAAAAIKPGLVADAAANIENKKKEEVGRPEQPQEGGGAAGSTNDVQG